MDLITGLPKSKGYEVILVVIGRLSKYGHLFLIKHPCTPKSVAEFFVWEVGRLHGIPRPLYLIGMLFLRVFSGQNSSNCRGLASR